jgi:hypothetical protein
MQGATIVSYHMMDNMIFAWMRIRQKILFCNQDNGHGQPVKRAASETGSQ